jgi:hypothetical protein
MHAGRSSEPPKKKRPEVRSGLWILKIFGVYGGAAAALELSHPGSLGALGSAFLVKGHPVAFGQRFEPAAFDGAEMHENIVSAVTFDEAVTLAVVEPFYSTFRHVAVPFLLNCVIGFIVLVRYFGATSEPLLLAKDRSSMHLKIPNQAPF